MSLENNIKYIVKGINKFSSIELLNIEQEINYIIKENITDINIIEGLLDRMLSLVFVEESILKDLYFRLIKYYSNINKDNSEEYKKIYIEQYGTEKVLKK